MIGAGSIRGNFGQPALALDVSSALDPTNTGAFISRINLPSPPSAIALANGLAVVAGGTSGLEIVNYAAFDTQGIAPTVSIGVTAVDADPNTPGTQVLEGRTVRVTPSVSDDIQVRNVELLVNGQVIANDVSFPFDLLAQVPTIASAGNQVTLQVLATDTGGNTTLSNQIVLGVVPDTQPPQVLSVSLADGAKVFFVHAIDIMFDEPLDLGKLSASGITLVGKGADGTFGTADDITVPVTVNSRSFGQAISIVPGSDLATGDYQLRIDPSVIVDRAGNALAAAIVRDFTIRPASNLHALSGIPAASEAPSANPGQEIGISVPFGPATAWATFQVIELDGNQSTRDVQVSRVDAAHDLAFFQVPFDALIGDVVVYSLSGGTRTDFADGTFLLQIVPTITRVDAFAGFNATNASIELFGSGFIEGNGTEYRAGSTVVPDLSTVTGPDVFGGFDANGTFVENAGAFLTMPLNDGSFGPISVTTAGGTSAPFVVGELTGIISTALSGTPADPTQASAKSGSGDHAHWQRTVDQQQRADALHQQRRRAAHDLAQSGLCRARRHQRHADRTQFRQRRVHAADDRRERPAVAAGRACGQHL